MVLRRTGNRHSPHEVTQPNTLARLVHICRSALADRAAVPEQTSAREPAFWSRRIAEPDGHAVTPDLVSSSRDAAAARGRRRLGGFLGLVVQPNGADLTRANMNPVPFAVE
jgi:hypothetical protein